MEELTKELQKKRAERLARISAGEGTGSDMSSVSPSLPEDDRKSLSSFQSEGYVHASQVNEAGETEGQPQVKRNKTQLWNEVKITCMCKIFGLNKRFKIKFSQLTHFQQSPGLSPSSTPSRCSLSSPVSNSTCSVAETTCLASFPSLLPRLIQLSASRTTMMI